MDGPRTCYPAGLLRPNQTKRAGNTYFCGPAALYHAILCYGDRANIRELARLAGTTREGTDEVQLSQAARELGFRLGHELCRTPAETYERLRHLLRERVPVIVCVDSLSHWVTVVRSTARHVWVADTDADEVLSRVTWRAFLRRAAYGLPDEMRFDLYPLTPA